MFALALLGIVVTGLPAYAVLLAVAAVFAMFGVATGAFDASLLGALPFESSDCWNTISCRPSRCSP